VATIKNILFDGYLKIYNVTTQDDDDEENPENEEMKIPKIGTEVKYYQIESKEEYTKPIGRFTEGSLVKKLEENEIGRPSTYASFISKIQERSYVIKDDVEGIKKPILTYTLKDGKITKKSSEVLVGQEKNKLIPTELGRTVTNYLNEHFPDIMDYKFTADMEKKLDDIVNKKIKWNKLLQIFYDQFHPTVVALTAEEKEKPMEDKLGKYIGDDPVSGSKIYASTAKYGPVVKRVELTKTGKTVKKYTYAPIKKPMTIENITLDQALELFKYPYVLGQYNGKDVEIQRGKYGLYIKYNKQSFPLPDEYITGNKKITLNVAQCAIDIKNQNMLNQVDKYEIREGKYGPYFTLQGGGKKKIFVGIPKEIDPKKITLEEINKLIEDNKTKKKTKWQSKGKKTI